MFVNPKDVQGLNLYAYCNNNPIMYYDPSGRFLIALIVFTAVSAFLGMLAKATVDDINEIASGNVYVDSEKTNSENVHIENSYKIKTPWVRYGYAFYLNHFNPETKDVIQGTTAGVAFEWDLHNLAALFEVGGENAKHLDVGKTIFADGEDHPLRNKDGEITKEGVMSLAMRVLYFIINPIGAIWDLYINGGF